MRSPILALALAAHAAGWLLPALPRTASAAPILFDTDALTLTADGAPLPTLNGTPFSVTASGGLATLTVFGNLELTGTTLTIRGSRAASFLVGNDVSLEGATINTSAVGAVAGPGGGNGGSAGVGFTGGAGGAGGLGGLGGAGGAGAPGAPADCSLATRVPEASSAERDRPARTARPAGTEPPGLPAARAMETRRAAAEEASAGSGEPQAL